MAWERHRTIRVAGAVILLGLGVLIICLLLPVGFSRQGSLRLPGGKGTPVVRLGERHGLILAADGSLWSWGSDFLGWPVLGLGNVPPQTKLQRIGSDTNWISMSSGTSHNVALKSDGTLWAWGCNLSGQFGVGPPDRKHAAVSTPVHAAPGNDWAQATAGAIHTIALKKDGSLWAWGQNWPGCLGTGSTSNSSVPVQVGSATNWVKIWAWGVESVGMQADGSLWYWGENPDPTSPQGVGAIHVPTRVSPDTNWVDVGFGVNTVFAIKSDGTLWAWGRHAHTYTGIQNPSLDATPARVGTNSDWAAIPACGGSWCQGLRKKDGSFWLMDASDFDPNVPRRSSRAVRFKKLEMPKDAVAFTAGALHAAAPGVHGPIAVAVTPQGEVWTWGLVLGDPTSVAERLQQVAITFANYLGYKGRPGSAKPVIRQTPWPLPHVEP
jgi:alpha-tubulin suppressor-like RCC1 family protein